MPPAAYQNPDSALANSLLAQPPMNGQARYPGQYQYPQEEWPALSNGVPQYENSAYVEPGVTSNPGSNYGSPTDDHLLPVSPGAKHLTALDAQLPSSFDSQGISAMARYGPVAASVPSRFGLTSPRSASGQNDVLRNLHDTAFGSDLRRPVNLGSSPSTFNEEGFSSRVLHSQRIPKTKMMSSSVPRHSGIDDWPDDNFAMEEDFVPSSLRDDVLTPQEKMRTLSRTEQDMSLARDFGALGISSSAGVKAGSPSMGSSPFRFGALFAQQRAQKSSQDPSSIGPVGSPLRESSFPFSSSPSIRPIGSRPVSGDVSPHFASPANRSSGSMSLISQQLAGNSSLHPSAPRPSQPPSRLDRSISSTSNLHASRIDEEGEHEAGGENDLFFSMEEEDGGKRGTGVSGGVAWGGTAGSGKSPNLGGLAER